MWPSEGLVGLAVDGNKAAVVEINAETDFVARNDIFQGFVRDVAALAVNGGDDVEALAGVAYPGTERNVGEQLTHNIATIGENMNLRRAATLEVANGAIASYVHNSLGDGLGKIGVLVGLESDGGTEGLEAVGKQNCHAHCGCKTAIRQP